MWDHPVFTPSQVFLGTWKFNDMTREATLSLFDQLSVSALLALIPPTVYKPHSIRLVEADIQAHMETAKTGNSGFS